MANVTLPEGTPEIGLAIRVVDGVPLLFTERGEYVRGQTAVTIHAQMRDVVRVDVEATVLVTKERAP